MVLNNSHPNSPSHVHIVDNWLQYELERRVQDELDDDILDEFALFCQEVLTYLDEEDEKPPKKRRRYIRRNWEDALERLNRDYFDENPRYPEDYFIKDFGMPKSMFLDIVEKVEANRSFFHQRMNATGRKSPPARLKVAVAIELLRCGCTPARKAREYQMSENTIMSCLKEFTLAVNEVFGPAYLRHPTRDEVIDLMNENEVRGFPGMVGSIDCCHWQWDACPLSEQNAFVGKEKYASFSFEAVATQDTYFIHLLDIVPGSLNDINIMDRSDVMDFIPFDCPYVVNGKEYSIPYFLADGIYPPYQVLMTPISVPRTKREKKYNSLQEAIRKDAERAFGILKKRFGILRHKCRLRILKYIRAALRTCVILHNMIVVYKRIHPESADALDNQFRVYQAPEEADLPPMTIEEIFDREHWTKSVELHDELQQDLISHIEEFISRRSKGMEFQ